MAKKTAEKKPRRRLKRTARRSMAAVLMITAVVVAAIPVPENVAAPEDGDIAVHADVGVPEPTAYRYPKTLSQNSICKNKLLSQGNEGDHKAYIVRQLSDGKFQMDWQFKFYLETMETGADDKGVISKYNGLYKQDEVTLPVNVIYQYDTIEPSKVSEYFSDNANVTFKCEKPDLKKYADQVLNKYFNTEYEAYVADYNVKKAAQDAWEAAVAAGRTPATPTKPELPEPLEKKVSQLSDDARLQYYCDANNSPNQVSGNTTSISLAGCKLVEVIDSGQKDEGGANHRVYIPQKIAGENASGLFDETYGLRYISDAGIIAIGDNAFKGIENVNRLNIPSELKYIGQSAFESSFIKEVSIAGVPEIGDRAFKNCTQLTKVDFGSDELSGTQKLGVECFYGTPLTEVVFPPTIKEIGPGSFAYCEAITKLDFSRITARPAVIDEYAFYNTRALSEVNFYAAGSSNVTVNIDTIGDAAFAVFDGETGNLEEFVFPSKIRVGMGEGDSIGLGSDVGMGDCILAGRANLKRVTMPEDFGTNDKAMIPNNLLYRCYNLERLIFPDNGKGSCGRATYQAASVLNSDGSIKTPGLFSSIRNENFIVQGPKIDAANNVAEPRRTTWSAETAVSKVVPYLYVENGLNHYEVSDGFYLLSVDNKGLLTSCITKPGAEDQLDLWDGVLKIPAVVGTTKVTAIDTNCFKDPLLNGKVKEVKIADNSVSTINASVFKNWKELQKVYIGNSVTAIGDSAFEGCNKLIDVTFNSPANGYGKDAFTIGKDAFKTGSSQLTFHGDIVKDYAPFEWATAAENIIKEPDGIRVCYKSLSPSFLTVMYDENTKLVTLLDYPKMSQVSELLNEKYADEIRDGEYGTYEHMRERRSYDDCNSSDAYKTRRDAFKAAWLEDPKTAYDSDAYGPWITPEFCDTYNTWGTTNPGGTGTGEGGNTEGGNTEGGNTEGGNTEGGNTESDESTEGGIVSAGAAIVDFLFEPIIVYAADRPDPYYTRHPFKVGSADSIYPDLNGEEINLLDAVYNIVVPEGVDSIDVYNYYHNSEVDDIKNRNRNNAGIYLEGKLDWDIWRMYTSKAGQDTNGSTFTKPGLFSGYYDDGLSSDTGERYKRGNDQITSVTLKSVKYLPNYAFDSCEKLLSVDLGPACSDIGIAPFRGCYEMETVGDNQWYTTTNGIIYSKKEDGSLMIEECLSARGRKIVQVGPPIVSTGTSGDAGDVNLKSVSEIKPGAFEDCDYLTEINFGSNNTAGLKVIPEDCFKNSDTLQKVVLPITVNDIGRGAFVGAKNLRELTIYGDEVKISGSAFNNEKVQTTVYAPEDSAVVRYVKEYGTEYNLVMDNKPFGRQWKVSFYDANYKQIEDLKDEDGNPMDNPQYVTNGDPAEFPADPKMDGWSFEEWIGLNGATRKSPIHEDTIFYAQGHFDGGMPIDGKWTVEIFDGIDGQRIGDFNAEKDGTYRVPVGESFADQGWTVKHPTHDGFEPNGFVFSYENGAPGGAWTINTVVDGNMKVIALYKAVTTSSGSTNTPGGTVTPSNGTTNTSNNSGNTGNTSGNSSNSSKKSSENTTSSSTSSSSTSTTSSTTSGAGVYTVFVENGSGSGTYAPGATVIIQAALPAAGMRFSHWTTDSNGVTLASASMSATTFTMPSNNVTVKANFVEDTGTAASPARTGNTADRDDGKTRVDIEKPGISNRDLATANVNGSTDNFIVKITETDESTRAVAAALTNKYGNLDNILYYAMDISLYDSTGTTKISDTTGLTVDITIPIPDSLVAYGGNNKAGAVVNSDQLENLNESFTTINGVPCIKFRATHFSPYTIYVDTGNLVEGMLDTTPKTGDPIHPKWFLSLGLACLSIILFMKKDKKVAVKAAK